MGALRHSTDVRPREAIRTTIPGGGCCPPRVRAARERDAGSRRGAAGASRVLGRVGAGRRVRPRRPTVGTWCALDRFEANVGKRVAILHLGQPVVHGRPGAWLLSPPARSHPRTRRDPARRLGLVGSSAEATPRRQPSPCVTSSPGASTPTFASGRSARKPGAPVLPALQPRDEQELVPVERRANGNRPGEFVRAWRHVHDIFPQVGATNVTWVWSPIVRSTAAKPFARLYPATATSTGRAWTATTGACTRPRRSWRTAAQVFGATYDRVTRRIARSKPIMIGETASTEYGGSQGGLDPERADAPAHRLPASGRWSGTTSATRASTGPSRPAAGPAAPSRARSPPAASPPTSSARCRRAGSRRRRPLRRAAGGGTSTIATNWLMTQASAAPSMPNSGTRSSVSTSVSTALCPGTRASVRPSCRTRARLSRRSRCRPGSCRWPGAAWCRALVGVVRPEDRQRERADQRDRKGQGNDQPQDRPPCDARVLRSRSDSEASTTIDVEKLDATSIRLMAMVQGMKSTPHPRHPPRWRR